MKIINFMNFVRYYEPRINDIQAGKDILFETTKKEMELAKEFGVKNTFLLEYDALIDERYINFFKENADENTELGLWFEIPKQLLDRVGLEWRGREGWTWDWEIIPGFSMAYTREERELIIDEAMNRFKEIYGYYPKSVASWLIDTYTMELLSKKYDVSYIGICRDQVSTDAYTLVGGYFNQAYYPSNKNMFTPAQTKEQQINTPVFRLLGPDPIHNYDNHKYFESCKEKIATLYTLEPAWPIGRDEEVIKWFKKSYFENEDLGFSYAQIGQENSFGTECRDALLAGLRLQLEIFTKNPEIKFMKTSEVGDWFKRTYDKTPATSVCAMDDWATGNDVQSVCYNCQKYTANVFRYKNKVFLRNLYLFNGDIEEDYLSTPCQTWDATYENLPVVDTLLWEDDNGIVFDTDAEEIKVEKISESSIRVFWKDKEVVLCEDKITLKNTTPEFCIKGSKAEISVKDNEICYSYKGNKYTLKVDNAEIVENDGVLKFVSDGVIELSLSYQ